MRLPFVAVAILCVLLTAAAQEPNPAIQPLMEASGAAHLKGDYESAREGLLKAWELAQQRPPADPVRYDVLKRLTTVRAAAGEFADADNYLQMAINWRETTLGQNDPKIPDDLLVSVSLCRGMKNYDRALFILQRVMGVHRQRFGDESIEVADDWSRMAQINRDQKNLPAAIGAWKQAIEIRSKIAGPLDASLVPDLDRLAATLIVQRSYDQAEAAYRQALVIRETLVGRDDADLIASVDGLAYACFGQQQYDQAEPIYQRLIALWSKSVGDDHPMMAIALDKVAVFYADQKKFDRAREAQEQATAIRAQFLASGLSTAATQQTAEGNPEAAGVLYRRALAVLEPPHPSYDEMRSDIEALLKTLAPPAAKAMPRKGLTKKK